MLIFGSKQSKEEKERLKREKEKKERLISSVMEKSGWKHRVAERQMDNAKENFGIPFSDFDKYNLWEVPVTEQEEKYRKIIRQKELRKRRREECISAAMEKAGWDREYAIAQIKDARARLGISYKDYKRYNFCLVSPEKQAAKYDRLMRKREREKEEKENNEFCLSAVMKETGWDREYAEQRMKESQEVSLASYEDYYAYRFWELNDEEQKKYLTQGIAKALRKYDTKESIALINNKENFDKTFSAYLGRPWCINEEITLDEFKEKFKNEEKLYYKPILQNRGKGIRVFDLKNTSLDDAYSEISNLQRGVVEGLILQHKEMCSLSASSVNTVRVVAVFTENEVNIIYSLVRMGVGDSHIDNFSTGGIVAAVDTETGTIITDGIDISGNVYKTHPTTGAKLKGFKIPFYNEAITMVKEANHGIEGYLGWDIAITETGPIIIEANTNPGGRMLQRAHSIEKRGVRYIVEKYL